MVNETKCAGCLLERNQRAQGSDFGIGIELFNDQMYTLKRDPSKELWEQYDLDMKRVRCTLGELTLRVQKTIVEKGLTDCNFIPVAVWASGSARFGQVASIFDVFKGMGFNNLGFFSDNRRPAISKSGTIELPTIRNGDSIEVDTQYANCVYITIDSGGQIEVDGSLVLESDDVIADATVFRRHVVNRFPGFVRKERWKNIVCLIFADKTTHVEHVDHAASAAMMMGFEHVAIVGLDKGEHKYIFFTTPTPDSTYWNLSDEW